MTNWSLHKTTLLTAVLFSCDASELQETKSISIRSELNLELKLNHIELMF